MEGIMTYAQTFFGWLLQTTLIASVVICLILLIQKMLGGKLGPRWCHALWLVLLIRMILPWAPSSRVSLLNLIPSWDRQIQQVQSSEATEQQGPSGAGQASESAEAVPAQTSESDVTIQKHAIAEPGMIAKAQIESKPRLVSLSRVLPVLWLVGAIVIGAYLLVSNFALWRIVKRDSPLVNQPMLELFEECKAQMGVESLVTVVPSSQIRSPGLFGFIRPRLLLPLEMLDTATPEEMRYVFLHELAHLKRRDIYVGWLTSFLQVLHWFNPLVWFAFYRMRADRELACDALVLARTQKEESQEYGQAIVSLVRRFSRSRPLPAMAGIMESKSQLKRRITMIAQFKKNSYQWSPLALILIVLLACVSLPEAKRTKASETAHSKLAHQPNFTKIRIPTKISWETQLSPDGQEVTLTSGGKLWKIPLSGKLGPELPGIPVRVNTRDVEVSRFGLAWSADGKWIAFNENDETPEKLAAEKNRYGIYVVAAQGGKPKKVCDAARGVLAVDYQLSLSPNGKTLAFSSVDRGDIHIYTISVDGGRPKQLIDTPAREPAFSPNGKMIAYVGANRTNFFAKPGGGLWVVPASGGNAKLVADIGYASSPLWSPDGNMIAFSNFKSQDEVGQICIIPVGAEREAAGEITRIDPPKGVKKLRLLAGWAPDNKIGAIFQSQQEYALYTLPAKGGKAAQITHGGFPAQPRWSPDGKRIFHTNIASQGSGAWKRLVTAFVPSDGGKVTTVPIQSDAKFEKPAIGGGNNVSPDGGTITFSAAKEGSAMQIWTLPVDGGQPKRLTQPPVSYTDWFPCWSPDGKSIAFLRTKGYKNVYRSTSNIYIVTPGGGELKALTSESDGVAYSSIGWSPDGKLMAFFSGPPSGDGQLKVIPVSGGQSRVVAQVKNTHVNKEIAWSPDGMNIAVNGPEGKVIKIISIDDGTITGIETDLVDTETYHLDWSPDGDRLAFGGVHGGAPELWVMENFLPEDLGK